MHEADASAGGPGAPPAPGEMNRAPAATREYRAEQITVQWYAERCTHSANCVRALPRVFDPKRRPWIDATAAALDDIAAAVLRCASGALHFVRTDAGAPEAPNAKTTLTPVRNGPLNVRGDGEMRGIDGVPVRHDSRMSLCRCGLAHGMPFCDNSCRTAGWREPA